MRTPEQCAQTQLDAYNTHDLDAFLSVYAEDTLIQRLADGETLMSGMAQMRAGYGQLFRDQPNIHAGLADRIVLGEFVVDLEQLTGRSDGAERRAAAIYHVRAGLIRRVWFVHDSPTDEQPTAIIEKQIAAYNARDTRAFAAAYSPECRLIELLSGQVVMNGREAVYAHYAPVHTNSPDLCGQIVKRMVLGAYVIDQEYITGRLGQTVEAVLVYEVENGLINRVWFLR